MKKSCIYLFVCVREGGETERGGQHIHVYVCILTYGGEGSTLSVFFFIHSPPNFL